MTKITQLLRESLPEIIGGLVVAAIISLVTFGYSLFTRPSEEPARLASDPSAVDKTDYRLPSEMNTSSSSDDSVYIPPANSETSDIEKSTDLSMIGTELWRIDLPGQVRAAPVVAPDGSLYLVTNSGVMLSIDPSGAEIWRVVLGGASSTRNYSRPVLTPENHIYIIYDGELLKLSSTGVLDWTFSKPGSGMLTAQPAVGPDGTVYIMTNNSALVAVSANGDELWSQYLCQVMGGGTWPGPVVGSDGLVYGVCKGEDIYALEPNDGTVSWTYHTNDRMESTPIAVGDLVYFASTGGWVIAMQADGQPRWQTSVAGAPGYIQMVDAPLVRGRDGLIYVTPRHGTIYALDPETGDIQWSAPIGGQGVGINPVAVTMDGYVYARNLNGDLLCVSPAGEVCWQISPADENANFSPPACGIQDELYLGVSEELIAFQTDVR